MSDKITLTTGQLQERKPDAGIVKIREQKTKKKENQGFGAQRAILPCALPAIKTVLETVIFCFYIF